MPRTEQLLESVFLQMLRYTIAIPNFRFFASRWLPNWSSSIIVSLSSWFVVLGIPFTFIHVYASSAGGLVIQCQFSHPPLDTVLRTIDPEEFKSVRQSVVSCIVLLSNSDPWPSWSCWCSIFTRLRSRDKQRDYKRFSQADKRQN